AALLLVRSRWPVTVLLSSVGLTLAYWLLDYPRGPIFLAPIVALFTAILAGSSLTAWTILISGYFIFGFVPFLLGIEPRPAPFGIIGLAGWMLLLGVAAEFLRGHRKQREEEARRRASEARERLAREVHDVLAHTLSVINVQAGVALHLLDEKPEQAR